MHPERTQHQWGWPEVALNAAVLMLMLQTIAILAFPDPDLWHLMALGEVTLQTGAVPTVDLWAYTPTKPYVVDHEWGHGVWMYLVGQYAGGAGLLAVKYLMVIGIVGMGMKVAIARGTSPVVLALCLWIGLNTGAAGFTTIRPGVNTYLALAITLWMMDRDRAGDRRWIAGWLVMWLFWLNVHGGCVLGIVLWGAHTVEQMVRRQPVAHLFGVGLITVLMFPINPYGLNYLDYLREGVVMDRTLNEEWRPAWETPPIVLIHYVAALALTVWAVLSLGYRRTPGLLVLLAVTYAATKHQRHMQIFMVVWLAWAPGWIEHTPLGEAARSLWQKWRRPGGWLTAVVAVAAFGASVRDGAFRLHGEHDVATGVVHWLKQVGWKGHLLTNFRQGAYISWHLNPDVKISLDNRYDVAYPVETYPEHLQIYKAEPGWQPLLKKFDPDAILVKHHWPLIEVLPQTEYRQVYADEDYQVWARPSAGLPVVGPGQPVQPMRFPGR